MTDDARLQSRFRQIASRKARREKLDAAIREGNYDHLIHKASDYFASPSARPRLEAAAFLPEVTPEEGPDGRVLVRRLVLEPDASAPACLGLHGPPPFDVSSAGAIAGAPLHPSDVLFLDTETTGLAGGAGTVAFLVGIGWWQQHGTDWRFHLEQLLIEDFCHEPELLRRVADHASRRPVLCTYNGRLYDVPLLAARAVLARIPPRVFRGPQLDLLHPSRRLWKHRLNRVTLKNVEATILGINRGPDIDGAAIPATFFHMSRTGDARRMGPVLQHNAQDIATLAGLLARHAAIHADPLGCGLLHHWGEFAAIAREREKHRDHDGAVAAWTRALEACDGRDPDIEAALLHRLARAHKRLRQWDDACALWHSLTARPPAVSISAWVEIAKYHEHVARNPASALDAIRQCRRRFDLYRQLSFYTETSVVAPSLLGDLDRREARLLRRLAASSPMVPTP